MNRIYKKRIPQEINQGGIEFIPIEFTFIPIEFTRVLNSHFTHGI